METLVEINGLPVKFSDQKPTKPCACWRIKQVGNVTYGPELTWVEHGLKTGKLIDNGSSKAPYIDELYNAGWRFSAPLVPVTEVEKAWNEGWRSCDFSDCPTAKRGCEWPSSNARKVVEGVK